MPELIFVAIRQREARSKSLGEAAFFRILASSLTNHVEDDYALPNHDDESGESTNSGYKDGSHFLTKLPKFVDFIKTLKLITFLNCIRLGTKSFITSQNQINQPNSTSTNAMATAAVPATCCGREGGCLCAKEATCSCGKQAAMHCNCEKSGSENVTAGARCSCSKWQPNVY